MAEEPADVVNEDAAADETEQGGRNRVPSSCTAEEERLRLQLIEMSITVLKVPAFPLRDKATNEYFTTVVGRRHQARGERVELDRGLCPAAARVRHVRKERDFLLAVKAREERAASRGISTGSGDC